MINPAATVKSVVEPSIPVEVIVEPSASVTMGLESSALTTTSIAVVVLPSTPIATVVESSAPTTIVSEPSLLTGVAGPNGLVNDSSDGLDIDRRSRPLMRLHTVSNRFGIYVRVPPDCQEYEDQPEPVTNITSALDRLELTNDCAGGFTSIQIPAVQAEVQD
ncbi:hypothetical protein H0H92_003736 [Tricholoma furcatifolium]|nr:hypothetical protein H0H92_003736 [Tricholoma furcatifolium]